MKRSEEGRGKMTTFDIQHAMRDQRKHDFEQKLFQVPGDEQTNSNRKLEQIMLLEEALFTMM